MIQRARSFEKHINKVEKSKEEDEVADLNMESINQKGLRKKNDHEDGEGRRGMVGSGNQGFGGPVGGQTTLKRPETIPLNNRRDEEQTPYKLIYKINYTTSC